MTKQVFFISFLFLLLIVQGQKPGSYKNKHVKYEVNVQNGNYEIDYTFQGITNSLITIHFSMAKKSTDKAIDAYGVPKSVLGVYQVLPKVVRERERLMEKGMYRQVKQKLLPDYNALISYYSPFAKPISELIVEILEKKKMDTERNRIELAMRLVQDIPYKVPPNRRKGKITSGLFTPPEILIHGYGDCDSKTILFIAIMRYLIDEDKIVILEQRNHMLTAIKAKIEKGSIYIRYRGEKYLIAETAGPGHWALGEKGDYFSNKFVVYRLSLDEEKL